LTPVPAALGIYSVLFCVHSFPLHVVCGQCVVLMCIYSLPYGCCIDFSCVFTAFVQVLLCVFTAFVRVLLRDCLGYLFGELSIQFPVRG
jgi:hypothetical protein